MSEFTYGEYLAAIERVRADTKELREGQRAFNVLTVMHPFLAEQIRTTPIDPFYLDDRLTDFYTFVCENWR